MEQYNINQEKYSFYKEYINLMRPKQYIKNLFVLSAIVFSGNIIHISLFYKSMIAFICFCLISSAVYILNDIVDIEKDKCHPKKCKRPLASGAIKKEKAMILGVVLVIASISLSLLVNLKLTAVIILYLLNNILYSFKLKNIVLLDVCSIAIGFILRLLAGSVSVGVQLSNWIILCTFFLSLFLGLGKRKKEINTLKSSAGDHRKILKDYNEEIINQMITVVQSCTIVCYALYSTSSIDNPNMIFTTIFVIYGIFRYSYIINISDEGNPTDVVLNDTSLKIDVFLWVVTCIIILLF